MIEGTDGRRDHDGEGRRRAGTPRKRKPKVGQIKASIEGPAQGQKIQTAGAPPASSRGFVNPKNRHGMHMGARMDREAGRRDEGADPRLRARPLDATRTGVTSLCTACFGRHDALLTHITRSSARRTGPGGHQSNKLEPSAPTRGGEVASGSRTRRADVILIEKVEGPATAADLAKFARRSART